MAKHKGTMKAWRAAEANVNMVNFLTKVSAAVLLGVMVAIGSIYETGRQDELAIFGILSFLIGVVALVTMMGLLLYSLIAGDDLEHERKWAGV